MPMIKIGNKINDAKLGNKQIFKVYKGSVVIWKKDMIKTISYESEETIKDWHTEIYVPKDIYNTLKGKDLIELAIGYYKVEKGDFHLNEYAPKFSLSKSMMDVAGLLDWIPTGTKITVTYK